MDPNNIIPAAVRFGHNRKSPLLPITIVVPGWLIDCLSSFPLDLESASIIYAPFIFNIGLMLDSFTIFKIVLRCCFKNISTVFSVVFSVFKSKYCEPFIMLNAQHAFPSKKFLSKAFRIDDDDTVGTQSVNR